MFPEISKETVLPSSWIIQKQEPPGESEAFLERVNSFLSRLIGSVDNRDILLVGHGATVKAMCRFFCRLAGAEESQQQPWNCSLSEFYRNDSDSWYVNFQNDISFLPRKIVTSNSRRLLDEFDND